MSGYLDLAKRASTNFSSETSREEVGLAKVPQAGGGWQAWFGGQVERVSKLDSSARSLERPVGRGPSRGLLPLAGGRGEPSTEENVSIPNESAVKDRWKEKGPDDW